jgi:LL-H family phage holin
MDPFVSDLINSLIVALVPVAIGALGYLAKQVIALLKANLDKEHYRMLEAIAKTAVCSIEQTLYSKKGEEKKAAALVLVRSECLKRGLKLDESAITAAIEAAVYEERMKVQAA